MAVKTYVECDLTAPPGIRLVAEGRINKALEPGSPQAVTMVVSMNGDAHVTRKAFDKFVEEVEAEFDKEEVRHKEAHRKHMDAERKGGRVDH